MALISLQNVSIRYGGPRLLDAINLHVEPGERICLVGRNGEGKSTLLRLLTAEEKPDSGERVVSSGVRIGFLPQAVPATLPGTVHDVVSAALPEGKNVDAERLVGKAISRLALNPDAPFNTLSGGQKRRALLARALVLEPEVLLLDEPTNHLDIPSIEWLENVLIRYGGSILFVTHDRSFLRKLATRIVELDRGNLRSWSCGYDQYLVRREEALAAEEKQNAVFDKKLAQEEVWIRQGIKARRTRNEGRVRALEKLRAERSDRRSATGSANMQISAAGTSGRKVIEVENMHFGWDEGPVVQDLTTLILRGDKIGIIGPNGCGKTTLISLLLGQLQPQQGRVELGTNLEIAYFDQHRETLDDELSVADNVADGNEFIIFDGKRRHVFSYLEDFLFSPDRSRTPVRVLSGGERNRLLLARLFTRPFNVLVLDEPTNDLDAETLDLLEDLLVEFHGTVLLVSHDRAFLNNVVTSTLVFEEDGRVGEYAGGYDDWLSQRKETNGSTKPIVKARESGRPARNKLTNREREELARIPQHIEALDAELDGLHAKMNDPEFYKETPEIIKGVNERAEVIPDEIGQAYERWAELEK
ncbi:MAG: ATP-binding cassette subfamily F protein uup [Kiritimatiellia bacterium]|jgi:ABC transport system ATP-binding/permease protein